MSTGRGVLLLAKQHIGQAYENITVPKNNSNWQGPWDCAEFVSWLVFQDSGILYGCLSNNANPAVADAYTGAWQIDSVRLGMRIPIAEAAAIEGGILLRFPPEPGKMGHIVVCDGKGKTVEAAGKNFGVIEGSVHRRRWDTGVLVPGLFYNRDVQPINILPPISTIYRLGGSNMIESVVENIQNALLGEGINPGPVDGIYGDKTAAAVAAFQQINGLIVDGEVGPQTALALKVKI